MLPAPGSAYPDVDGCVSVLTVDKRCVKALLTQRATRPGAAYTSDTAHNLSKCKVPCRALGAVGGADQG